MPHAPRRLVSASVAGLVSLGLALTLTPTSAVAVADPPPEPAPVATTISLAAPARVVDERAVTLVAQWRTVDDEPVVGGAVRFERLDGKAWKLVARRTSGALGGARFTTTPRTDSVWRVRGLAGPTDAAPGEPTWTAATSSRARIDNVPPGTVVRLAGPAPSRRLPAQRRAVGKGANPVVTRIGNPVWRNMVGRSWHRGCPVGRDGLRLLRANYWGFDGYRHRGELVMATSVVHRAAAAMTDMHDQRLPLRSVYRVDRFGWSSRVQGADDHASMAADNTSAFNCRSVVNRPGVRSPHATGKSIDMNPWENPYHSRTGWVPNTYWVSRSHPTVAWRSVEHPVVRIWRAHGFRWTYGNSDSQHWDGRRAPMPMGSFVG